MITFKTKGDWSKTIRFLTNAQRLRVESLLATYGKKGVDALAAATPKDSGETAQSWIYEVKKVGDGKYSLSWSNTNVNNGVPIAILIQYGHGTGTGGYVEPIDYINPTMKAIFAELSESLRKEVSNL